MRWTTGTVVAAAALAIGCGDITQPAAASMEGGESAARAPLASVTGSGHLQRDLGAGPELTTFSYSAHATADGGGNGQFQFNFRAADLKVHGYVTCVTTAGNVGWIGGVIDRLTSGDPADQALVGTDIWWRVVDNGEGGATPDRTTSLLFTFPGGTITAASWCADQPVAGFERPIEQGDIQLH